MRSRIIAGPPAGAAGTTGPNAADPRTWTAEDRLADLVRRGTDLCGLARGLSPRTGATRSRSRESFVSLTTFRLRPTSLRSSI
jgi:hypothetical protein